MDFKTIFLEHAWVWVWVVGYWLYIWWSVKDIHSTKTARDFFIANRSLPTITFVFAATATYYSGWTFMSQPSLIYRDGFQAAYASFYVIFIPFAGMLFWKRQWLLSKRYGFITPGEMFGEYFKSSHALKSGAEPGIDELRWLVLLVALFVSVLYISIQFLASGFLFNVLTGLPTEVGMILLSFVVLAYVLWGGLRAVAYVDTMQAVLLSAGIFVIGYLVLDLVGGFEGLKKGIITLSEFDPNRAGANDYSHFLVIPSLYEPVKNADDLINQGGYWTATFILTYGLASLGNQASPSSSMWAFSNQSPKPFVWHQVVFSALIIGFLLFVFTAIQGMGAHLLGANQALLETHPEFGQGLPQVPTSPSAQREQLLPRLILLILANNSWLIGFFAVCALAAMQSTAAPYMATFGSMFSRDIIKRHQPNLNEAEQIQWGRLGALLIAVLAIGVALLAKDAIALVGGLAVAFGLQLWPALVGICWWSFLTRQGIIWGLLIGLLTVIVTENPFKIFGVNWIHWPLTIHSAGWGIVCNFLVAIIVSCMTQNSEERRHRESFHRFLKQHAGLSEDKRGVKVFIAWSWVFIWFFFAVGPGALIGNNFFGDPNDFSTWWFLKMPSIWVWQLLWWMVGVAMMWFLAYHMELSTEPKQQVIPLRADYSETSKGN